MGQVPQCTGRLCWEIKVFFKSVLLFVEVLYPFVTYLLTYLRRWLCSYRRLAYLHESHFTDLVRANAVNVGCGSGNSTCEIMHQAAREQLWLNWEMFTNANCTDGGNMQGNAPEIPMSTPIRSSRRPIRKMLLFSSASSLLQNFPPLGLESLVVHNGM
jgi:hypothetical protein